jgi:DNA-binding MarR family transcriptional regulator
VGGDAKVVGGGLRVELPRRRHLNERGKAKRAYQAYVDLRDTADWLGDLLSMQLDHFGLTMKEYRVMERIFWRGPQYQQDLSRRFRCSKQNVGWVIKRLEYLGRVVRLPGRVIVDSGGEIGVEAGGGLGARGGGGEGLSAEDVQRIAAENVGGGGWWSRERRKRLAAYARGKAREIGRVEARERLRGDVAEYGRSSARIERADGRPVTLVQLTAEGRALIEDVYLRHVKYVKSLMRALEGREQETLSRLCGKLRRGDVLKFCREMVWQRENVGPDRGY